MMDIIGKDLNQIYSGIFFPHNDLHVTFDFAGSGEDEPVLPPEVAASYYWREGKPLQEVFIYGMVALEEMSAYACYLNTKEHKAQLTKDCIMGKQYKFQHNSDTPLHITLDTGRKPNLRIDRNSGKLLEVNGGKDVKPVDTGLKLKDYIKNSWMNDEPDMYGFVRFPQLVRWVGVWDVWTDKGSYYDYCNNKE